MEAQARAAETESILALEQRIAGAAGVSIAITRANSRLLSQVMFVDASVGRVPPASMINELRRLDGGAHACLLCVCDRDPGAGFRLVVRSLTAPAFSLSLFSSLSNFAAHGLGRALALCTEPNYILDIVGRSDDLTWLADLVRNDASGE